MESFVIEVDESWTELDVFKSAPTKKYTTVDSLERAYPSRSDTKLRDYYSIDLKSLLNLCYVSRSQEKRKSSSYPSSSGDGGDVLLRAICRITYKKKNDVGALKETEKN